MAIIPEIKNNAARIAKHSNWDWHATEDYFVATVDHWNQNDENVEDTYLLEENSDGVYFYRNGDEFVVFKNTNEYLAVDYALAIDALIKSFREVR